MSEQPETLPSLPLSAVHFLSDQASAHAIPRSVLRRWEDHLQTFHALLSQAPSVYQTLLESLRTQLGSDPISTALRFQVGSVHTTDVSLVALAVHARHHPAAPANLDSTAIVVDLAGQSPLLNMTPSQLLAHVARLDLVGDLRLQWNSYWQARAKGTPTSRHTHALNQYLGLLRASWEAAVAVGEFDDQQQRPVTGLLNNPEWMRVGNQRLHLETPLISGKAVPGALVFSVEDEPALMFYQPGRKPAFSAHATRQALTTALMEQASAMSESIGFQSHDTLSAGFTTLFDSLLDARLKALEHDPGADIQQYGELALSLIHWVDSRQRSPDVFQAPPLLMEEDHDEVPQLSFYDFGNLGIEAPYLVRLEQIIRQRNLLDSTTQEDLQFLSGQRRALLDACDIAEKAIEQLLSTDEWRSAQTATVPSDLLTAHHQGLRAHARLQNTLGQINDEELRWIESLLDQPDSFPGMGSSIIAAHPQLNTTTVHDDTETSTSTVVHDCLIVTLQNEDAPHSLLLYWPGESGGLIRCANQEELERCFGLTDTDGLSLQLTHVTGDVLEKVLDYHLSRSKIASQSSPSDDSHARIRTSLAQSLQIPRHAAREFAFSQLQAEQASATLSETSVPWLANLTATDRQTLRSSTLAYIDAMRRSQALISRDLPNLSLFCRQHINQRLQQDFPDFDGSSLSVDLPKSTSLGNDPVAGSGAPGVPVKQVPVASDARETLSLETLLLENIDAEMKSRLGFMKLQTTTSDSTLEQALRSGFDADYLIKLAKDIDLAQKREDMILAAYRGTEEGYFARQFRRECLGEPLRLMLKMHSVQARTTGDMNAGGQAILDIAIDADSTEAYRANGHDIRLIPARLTAGGEDTESYGVTLSGVTFITDQKSGNTLLYCPDHPKKHLRQYSSLEAARLGLYELSKQSGEIDYMAGRALLGDPDSHRSRMRLAIEHRFDGIIGLGSAWPRTTSLAQHLLDAQGGRVLEAHRATSRSNQQLWLENFAYQSGMIFNYIKMALGFVPVIGLAVGAYDYYKASANAAAALVRGEVGKALDELEQALLSFIDGAMDVLPSVVAKSSIARRLTRQRQLRQLLKGPGTGFRPGAPSAQKRLEAFEGYEYHQPLSLMGIQPGLEGKYRGIYQHADGDFILVEDRPCQVEWLETEHTWRLRGNAHKTWRKNIALDENGQWNTHFALYGVHLHGGGSGGGQVVGRLADLADPLWPAPIRDRLPRWWTDATHRRRLALKENTERTYSKLADQYDPNDQLKNNGSSDPIELARIDRACADEIAEAKAVFKTLEEYRPLLSGNNLADNSRFKNSAVTIIVHRSFNRVSHARKLAKTVQNSIGHSGTTLLTQAQFDQYIQQIKKFIETLDHIENLEKDIRTWLARTTNKQTITAVNADLPKILNVNHFTTKTSELAQLVHIARPTNDLAWQYFNDSIKQAVKRFEHALSNHHNVHKISLASERKTLLRDCVVVYQQHISNLRLWSVNYPQYFDSTFIAPIGEAMEQLTRLANKELGTAGAAGASQTVKPKPAAPGQPPSRVFETEDEYFLIGSESVVSGAQPHRFSVTGPGGLTETYVQGPRGKWQLESPRPPAAGTRFSLQQLMTEAKQRLGNIEQDATRIRAYIKPDSIPAELEDLMNELAEQLRSRAQKIHQLDDKQPLIASLRSKAAQLAEQGKQLRITQALASQKPNAGHLDYLVAQQAIDIIKKEGLIELARSPEGRRDFMQEYEVRDLTQTPPRPLWYAHFHYNAQSAAFSDFVKAHLKLRDYRYLGSKWQQSLGAQAETIWRGDINREIASKHFQLL